MSGLKPTTDTSMSVDPRTSEATAAPQPTTGEAFSKTPHNTQPLRFHAVHGKGVRISRDGTAAANASRSGNKLAFSARPVRTYEKVCFRLYDISNSSSIIVGFTPYDPSTLAYEIKVDTKTFLEKPENVYRFVYPRFYENDNILSYYFDSAGKVHFEINCCYEEELLSSVDTNSSSLWASVYLSNTALQLIDIKNPFDIERILTTHTLFRKILLPTRYPGPLEPLSLHKTKGSNVRIVNELAIRLKDLCQGYVFTALPMRLGQTILVQILETEPSLGDSLAIGLTSCDPATLSHDDLPDDTIQLLDRPEYWVVRRNTADGLRSGDEVAVTLTIGGEVQVSVNGSNTVTVTHVDYGLYVDYMATLRLWAFVDIYGATQKVRLLSTQATRAEIPPQQLRDVASSATLTPNTGNRQYIEPTQATPNISLLIDQAITLLATISSALKSNRPRTEGHHSPTSHNNSNQQFQMPNRPAELNRNLEPSTSLQIPSTSQQNPLIGKENPTNPKCTLCFENPIDCVLYKCGHMCMCYSCGVKQWKETGNGQCPICRKVIKDIIRTYKS